MQMACHVLNRRSAIFVAVIACAAWSGGALAETSGLTLDLRYRYELVDDDAFARDANAHTLRTRLGYRWVATPHWSAFVEGEYIEGLGAEHFNSTTNGKQQFPVVADPDETELNQAYLRYSAEGFTATLGRQRVVFANLRFVGNVGFRQNEQTYDSFDLSYQAGASGPAIHYAWLDRAHRVFGDHNPQGEWNLDGHALTVTQALPLGSLAGYLYAIDNQDVATASTTSWGLRWTGRSEIGSGWSVGWAAEAARQTDYRNNPLQVKADYRLLEPDVRFGAYTLKAGWERLEGNGSTAFQTPLATLHAFNGWADRFLTTPADGLLDRYAGLSANYGKLSWQLVWHDFDADRGGRNYGTELNAQVAYAFSTHWSSSIAFADYDTQGFSSDERKAWVTIEYRL